MIFRTTRAGHRAGCMIALALTLSPSTSSAQQAIPGQLPTDLPQRPTGAVFGGYRQPQRDLLALTTETYGGYDQELQGPPGGSGFGAVRTGAFAGLDAALNYSPTQSTSFDFNARGFTSLRLYTQPTEFIPANSNGDVSASYRLSRRATLQGRGGFMYTPYFDFPVVEELPLPGVITPVPIRVRDRSVSPRRVGTYDGGADLSYGVTNNVAVGTSYGVRRTDVIQELSDEPLGAQRAAVDTTLAGRVDIRFNRRTNSRVAYLHREGQYDAGLTLRPVRVNDLQFSVDRDWARTPTRRTAMSFMIGPSRVEQDGRETTRASAGVALTHTFARSWDFRASYRRGLTFLDTAPAPIPSNSYTVNLDGLVTRRLQISVGVAAILGEVGLDASSSAYDSYAGSARVRYALMPRLAVYGEYVYQSLAYSDRSVELAPGQDRAGVRAGVAWYVPLKQESTRPERPGTRRSTQRP